MAFAEVAVTCYGCKKKVDPILTFARPHGRYSKCEECRKKAREVRRKLGGNALFLSRKGIFRSKD